mmetsp:Transcript_55676/g.134951  ORF Transcript_55676/g.134951 Transcript_55676/m.134951 type:complete len:247 (-) Transcript_55676:121-861(-)
MSLFATNDSNFPPPPTASGDEESGLELSSFISSSEQSDVSSAEATSRNHSYGTNAPLIHNPAHPSLSSENQGQPSKYCNLRGDWITRFFKNPVALLIVILGLFLVGFDVTSTACDGTKVWCGQLQRSALLVNAIIVGIMIFLGVRKDDTATRKIDKNTGGIADNTRDMADTKKILTEIRLRNLPPGSELIDQNTATDIADRLRSARYQGDIKGQNEEIRNGLNHLNEVEQKFFDSKIKLSDDGTAD